MKQGAAWHASLLWLLGHLRCFSAAAVLSVQQLRGRADELHPPSLANAFSTGSLAVHTGSAAGGLVSKKDVEPAEKPKEKKKDVEPAEKPEEKKKEVEPAEKPAKKSKKKSKKESKKESRKKKRGKSSKKGTADSSEADENLATEIVDQATKQPFKKRFDVVDRNGNGKIEQMEYFASTRAPRRLAKYRFNCGDVNLDGGIDLPEFTQMQDKPQDLERCVSMMLAFRMMDGDRDGVLSQKELWASVGGATSFDGRWAYMVACSDLNRDGKVSPMEFSSDMYTCTEDKSQAALEHYAEFKNSDTNRDGCADEAEMTVAVHKLFGLNLLSDRPPREATRVVARRWMSCGDFDASRCLDKEEFSKSMLEPDAEMSHCLGPAYEQYEANMDFEIMDANKDGRVSKQEYFTWCSNLDLEIDHEDAEALYTSADTDKSGFIEENEFIDAGESHSGDGPGALFFIRSTDPTRSSKSRTEWRGSLRKTWAGMFES